MSNVIYRWQGSTQQNMTWIVEAYDDGTIHETLVIQYKSPEAAIEIAKARAENLSYSPPTLETEKKQ